MANRLQKLRSRRIDPLVKVAAAREVYERLFTEDTAVKYAIGSMQPIDQEYTSRTIEERNRVEKQLKDGYLASGLEIQFDYQGSVTNDTHVRVYSDVDLLTVEQQSVVVEPPNKPADLNRVVYQGSPVEDLRLLRRNTVQILRNAFPAATVDDSKGKCIGISGGSLKRHIDVVASNWWWTIEYISAREKQWLGVQVLDTDNGSRVPNKPFRHNKLIIDRDNETGGGLRKAIRLFKSLKYDSDEKIDLSSYDLASLAYNIFPAWLSVPSGQDLLLVSNCRDYLRYLLYDADYRNTLEVPNKMRKVFGVGGATEVGLQQLSSALDSLVAEIEGELNRTVRKLKETRIDY